MSSPQRVANPYQRRLGLLALGMLAVLAGLASRHAWLSLVRGDANRRAAMSALVDQSVLPTVRGSITDIRGEPLAREAAPGYAIEARFSVIDAERWVRAEASRVMRRTMKASEWRALGSIGRERQIELARPEVVARRRSMLRAIATAAEIPYDEFESSIDDLRRSVERLARHVQARQRREWAAVALGTDRRSLESLALRPTAEAAGRAAPAGLRFGPAAVARLGLDREELRDSEEDAWSLDALLEAAGIDPGAFEPQLIREQVQFHEIAAPIAPDQAFTLRSLAAEMGLGDVVRVTDARIREQPWDRATVEVDGSMLPGALRFDDVRSVPVERVGRRIIGGISPVYAEDYRSRPFDVAGDRGGYRAIGDRIGRGGVEGIAEDRLRGERGLRRSEVRLGIVDDALADETVAATPDLIAPVHGEDVRTTIDVRLQARIRAALSPEIGLTVADREAHGTSGLAGVDGAEGHPLAVGVAVIDVATGDVLALVNGPRRSELPDPEFEPLIVEDGWLDLDIAGRWGTTPGSTIKPLILTAAISEGLISADQAVQCTGHYYPESRTFARCWIYRPPALATHGALDGPEAIAQSCNIYFHHAADAFVDREERLVAWLEYFGLGRRPGGVSVFGSGMRPSVESISGWSRVSRNERVMVGTGQAQTLWTPLQAAAAYASFFRAGQVPEPRLIRDDGGAPRGASSVSPFLDGTECIPTPEAIWATTEGLERSISGDRGTGHHVRIGPDRFRIFTPELRPSRGIIGRPYESVMIWGKTGTAQETARLRRPAAEGDATAPESPDGSEAPADETLEERRVLSHGWFAGVVASDDVHGARGEYAISVVVRWGGSGGRSAGPIANQVVMALMQEGYLPLEPGLRPTKVLRGTSGSRIAAIGTGTP